MKARSRLKRSLGSAPRAPAISTTKHRSSNPTSQRSTLPLRKSKTAPTALLQPKRQKIAITPPSRLVESKSQSTEDIVSPATKVTHRYEVDQSQLLPPKQVVIQAQDSEIESQRFACRSLLDSIRLQTLRRALPNESLTSGLTGAKYEADPVEDPGVPHPDSTLPVYYP